MSVTELIPAAALMAAAVAFVSAAASDIRTHLIPNRLSAIAVAAFSLMATRMPPAFLWGGVLVGLASLAIGALLFARGWVGGGDVKLFTAAALWAGPTHFLGFAMITSVAGLAMGAAMLSPLGRFVPRPAGAPVPARGISREASRQPMAFGVAIAAGALFVLGRLA